MALGQRDSMVRERGRAMISALLERGEGDGCIELSEVNQLAVALDLGDSDVEDLYEEIYRRGIELSDDCAREEAEEARYVNDALAVTTTDALQLFMNEVGRYRLLSARFRAAGRAAAEANAVPDEEFDAPADAAKVLRRFVKDGRLTSIPTSHGKRLVVLDWLAQRFEPGEIYPERAVNLTIGKVHSDYATLRRYLVDDGFLERRDGFYWRAGGSFDL